MKHRRIIRSIRKNRKQIALFVIVGALSAVVEIIVMKIVTHPLVIPAVVPFEVKLKYPVSNVIATSSAILFNYYLSVNYVFTPGKHSKRREFAYFTTLSLLTMLLSYGLFAVFLTFITTPVDLFFFTFSEIIFCKILAIGIVSILNYIVKKKIIFHK